MGRSATKISIFSMRPPCVANIVDIKRKARRVKKEGSVEGRERERMNEGKSRRRKGRKKGAVFAAERLTCNELP